MRALALAFAALVQGAVAQSVTAPGLPERIDSSRPAAPAEDRILPLEASVNGARAGVWVFLERRGVLHAPDEAIQDWRVRVPEGVSPIDFRGVNYWPLPAFRGFKAKIDSQNQSVALAFAPEEFTALKLEREMVKRPVVTDVLPSAFLNYDVSYTGSKLRAAPRLDEVGALAEVGVSGKWGVLTSSQLGRNLANDPNVAQPRAVLRLETTLTRDFPERNRTLRLGDAQTRAGMWGRNVYFGGVQYGTNYALTPGFVKQPLPVLQGLSATPSTVELYVNDVLRQVSNVPTGPFALDNFPVVTGNGEARLVVRDLLGRETVITQSFFAGGQLLAPSLDDWSVEAGKVRRGLGVTSGDYGDPFASGTWRRGVTAELTLEARGEVSRHLRSLGAGASFGLPWRLLGTAAFAASDHDTLGRGSRWLLGLDRQGASSSASLQVQGSTRRMRVLGQEDDRDPYRVEVAGNWTLYTPSWGTFGLGFASLSRFDEPRVTTVSGNYSINIGRTTLVVSASRALAGVSGNAVGLSFVTPLDGGRNLSGAYNSHEGTRDYYVAASQSPSASSGLAWRLLAGEQQRDGRAEAGLYYLGDRGSVSGEASVSPDRTAGRVSAAGGVVLADGHVFSTRRIDQAFAIAEVPGYGGVGVGVGSTVLARTDARGVALIPNLWPYQENGIRLDPRDLPVSAELDSIEQPVVPAWRSAVKVKFPVRSGRGALLRIVLDDGDPAPAGATVRIEGDKEEFYVGRRGEAFVTGLQAASRVVLRWRSAQCAFDVRLPPENPDEVPRVGPLPCAGVAR